MIPISVGAPTTRGRLFPQLLRFASTLALESRVRTRFSNGVSMDSEVDFGLFEDRVLANVEARLPVKKWVRRSGDPGWPANPTPGDIVFDASVVDERYLSFEYGVYSYVEKGASRDSGVILVEFESAPAVRRVSLSQDCLALVSAHGRTRLLGFLVRRLEAHRE